MRRFNQLDGLDPASQENGPSCCEVSACAGGMVTAAQMCQSVRPKKHQKHRPGQAVRAVIAPHHSALTIIVSSRFAAEVSVVYFARNSEDPVYCDDYSK